MKRITPVLLTAFSALALSFSVATFADNTDSDGFIIFGAQEVSQTANSGATERAAVLVQEAAPAKVSKKRSKRAKKAKNKVRKRAKRLKRKTRQQRSTRTKQVKRSKSLRKASSYRVRKGDTLYRISVNSGVSLNRLIRLNKLHGSKKHTIQAGQRLRLR